MLPLTIARSLTSISDIFILLTDPALIPPRTHAPAEYPPAANLVLDRPSTIADIARFFTSFCQSDFVGRIALNHLRVADACVDRIASSGDRADVDAARLGAGKTPTACCWLSYTMSLSTSPRSVEHPCGRLR